MGQFERPAPATPDYSSTIIGALELSEKKWVLAARLGRIILHLVSTAALPVPALPAARMLLQQAERGERVAEGDLRSVFEAAQRLRIDSGLRRRPDASAAPKAGR